MAMEPYLNVRVSLNRLTEEELRHYLLPRPTETETRRNLMARAAEKRRTLQQQNTSQRRVSARLLGNEIKNDS